MYIRIYIYTCHTHETIKLLTTNSIKNHDPCCLRSGVAQMMALGFLRMINAFNIVYMAPHLTVVYDDVGLAVAVAHMRACTYTH